MSGGRPKINVDAVELRELWDSGRTRTEIANELGISRETLRRVMNEDSDHFSRTNLTDDELDEVTLEIKCLMPNAGERLIIGGFRSKGLNIPRHHIRASIRRVDVNGVRERTEQVARRIRRRVYGSPFPHYCWHVDGNHKLIRWGMVVHCAIDGFSRACTFIQCSDNNRALTVYELFIDACEQFSIPMRVRTDHGGENALIWEGMSQLATEANPNPVTVGASVHNQRVERFNRDINNHVHKRFANQFYSLERLGLLDIENKLHLAALHFVYIPRVNAVLKELKLCHNNHPIRTERNMTPLQLIARHRESHETPSDDDLRYSDRSTAANNIPNNPVSVVVDGPGVCFAEMSDDYLENIDVCADDGSDGKNTYIEVKQRLLSIIERV